MALLVLFVFVLGFVLGAFVVFRRDGTDNGLGAERVGTNIGELGKQQQSITESVNRTAGLSNELASNVTATIDASSDMEKQIQRAKDIVAGIRTRNKDNKGDSTD